MNTLEETKIKLLAIDCLQSMKQQKTFRKLSRELSLPAGVLNRYINGYVLPKTDRAETLINFFIKNYLPKILEASKTKKSKYFVTAHILSQPFLLNVIAFRATKSLESKINVVFTAASDGIPIAQAIANLIGAKFIYAKLTQEFTFSDHYASKSSGEKPISTPFYLPKSLLKRNDDVLIVDDVIRAGTTFEALTSICDQAKANISGIFALFIISSAYRELKKKHKVNYLVLAKD
ncbi:hypothetical protein CMO88_02720 [Candidatus Woesearchaeota archaeon]|nr:hypothetical protein [Candidatus Woesearchaeota archaeon]|tara:strand:- start:9555 stop:10256 length:702 start_codon:yes stop_codon:yes gene_type:complete